MKTLPPLRTRVLHYVINASLAVGITGAAISAAGLAQSPSRDAERAHRDKHETLRAAVLTGYIAAHRGIPLVELLDTLDREGEKLLQRRLAEEGAR